MIIQRRKLLRLAGIAATLPVASRIAFAETYPSRPVRILVATAASGGTDLAARLVAKWLTDKLGQSFFVENRPGGGNNIGTEAAAHSSPDGYTLFMGNTVNTINASLYERLTYNFLADLVPVVGVMTSPLLLLVHPSVPAKTVPEFIAYAKANPDTINMGSGGNGSTGHLAGELFKMMAGVRLVHVPYRGEAPAVTDLIGGQVQVAFITTGSSIQYAKAGTLRTLAITTRARLDALPDVPPLAQFLPGYEASGWSGLCAPKDTPANIVDMLNSEINKALADPTIRQRIADLGSTTSGGTSAEFAKFLAEDTERWAKVVKFAGVKVN